MRDRKWGRIINVLNVGAKVPNGGGAPTSVSRAAGAGTDENIGKRECSIQYRGEWPLLTRLAG